MWLPNIWFWKNLSGWWNSSVQEALFVLYQFSTIFLMVSNVEPNQFEYLQKAFLDLTLITSWFRRNETFQKELKFDQSPRQASVRWEVKLTKVFNQSKTHKISLAGSVEARTVMVWKPSLLNLRHSDETNSLSRITTKFIACF